MFKLRKTIKALPGIYGIKNLITKQIYIGSAENIRTRLSHHFSKLAINKHPNKELQRDFIAYGYDSFICVVFKYKPFSKLTHESRVIRLLLNANIKLYNSVIPNTNQRFKIADKNTTKYIIKQTRLKRTYTDVTNLKEFYAHNKALGCPNPTKLYEMVLDNTSYRDWTIEIDSNNAKEIITERQRKKGLKPVNHTIYYKRLINWKITNILTKTSIIIPNLGEWCRNNNIHYNQFQRYQDTMRIYKGIWKLEKV
jgi:group I intron endonuclease